MTKSTSDSHHEARNKDWHLTIENEMETEIKVLGSRFIAHALPAQSAEEFIARLANLKKLHYSATHHCFAYRLGADCHIFRYHDDGEPSGTAGKRILGAIDRVQLTNTAVVVIRYFGGTKLGVSRLGQAYGDAAREVLSQIPVIKKFIRLAFRLFFEYDHMSTVHHLIETHGAEILDRQFDELVCYSLDIRASSFSAFENAVRDMLPHTVRMERVNNEE